MYFYLFIYIYICFCIMIYSCLGSEGGNQASSWRFRGRRVPWQKGDRGRDSEAKIHAGAFSLPTLFLGARGV